MASSETLSFAYTFRIITSNRTKSAPSPCRIFENLPCDDHIAKKRSRMAAYQQKGSVVQPRPSLTVKRAESSHPSLGWKAATLGFLLGFPGRLEMDLRVGERVGGKIEAILPKVAPDSKDSFERLADNTA